MEGIANPLLAGGIMERLDKILSNLGIGSRKDVKALIKKGLIRIDDEIVKDSNKQIDPENCRLFIEGEEIKYRKYIYLMMNKPASVLSATFDDKDGTVIDLLEDSHKVFDPFPIGRLDKDTVGLLLLTNDGDLNHRLISPKHHVPKVYYAKVNMPLSEKDIKSFKDGIVLDDGYKSLPGELQILESNDESSCKLTIYEGKYHQVKRMFNSLGGDVTYLKRLSFGKLDLDENLKEGEYRELSDNEIKMLKNE